MRWGELVILGVMVVPLNLLRFKRRLDSSDQRPSETLSALREREGDNPTARC
jgi:hypothetical protein